MDSRSLKELMDCYLTGTLNKKQRKELSDLLQNPEMTTQITQLFHETFAENTFEGEDNTQRHDRIYQQLKYKILQSERPAIRRRPAKVFSIKKWAAAAALLIAVFSSVYYFLNREPQLAVTAHSAISDTTQSDVLPGHPGATLTLSDGSVLVLDSSQNGLIGSQGQMRVIKEDGRILYEGKNAEVLYNTIHTGKGRQWALVLPDGSEVWLNSESSIRYPLSFNKNERKVAITGEVYFEVKHDDHLPFRVQVADNEIEVLGTNFNINSYPDEPGMKTTLLKGSIRVSTADSKMTIHPGQEAFISKDKSGIQVTDVDAENAIAWKNGYFNFHNANLQAVMRQLTRWYDLEVVYPQRIPSLEFEGAIDQSLNLSAVLRILSKTGVHFKIEPHNKLIIMSE